MNFRPLYDWGIINYTSTFPLLQRGVRGKEKTRIFAGPFLLHEEPPCRDVRRLLQEKSTNETRGLGKPSAFPFSDKGKV